MVATIGETPLPPPARPGWPVMENWAKIKPNMTSEDVSRIIGEPASISMNESIVWGYANVHSCGHIVFNKEMKVQALEVKFTPTED